MRKKKLWIVIFAIVLALQIATPVGMILWHTDLNRKILEEGTEYRLRAEISNVINNHIYYDLPDLDRYPLAYGENTPYYLLEPLDDGFTALVKTYQNPEKDAEYILKSADPFPEYCNYTCNTAQNYLTIADERLLQEEACTLTLCVYNHRYTVTGLYDSQGRPIEVLLEELYNAHNWSAFSDEEPNTP